MRFLKTLVDGIVWHATECTVLEVWLSFPQRIGQLTVTVFSIDREIKLSSLCLAKASRMRKHNVLEL
jgi:hypothetical protein